MRDARGRMPDGASHQSPGHRGERNHKLKGNLFRLFTAFYGIYAFLWARSISGMRPDHAKRTEVAKMMQKWGENREIVRHCPPLSAFARLVRLCPPFFARGVADRIGELASRRVGDEICGTKATEPPPFAAFRRLPPPSAAWRWREVSERPGVDGGMRQHVAERSTCVIPILPLTCRILLSHGFCWIFLLRRRTLLT
jgi:hypothetical protein